MKKTLLLLILVISFSFINHSVYSEDQVNLNKNPKVPDFQVKIIGSPAPLTKEKLLGKIYLLDFWVTRCKKCQGKMPLLHYLYEKYKDKNFIIISVAYDKSVEDIENFRKGQWKMPWLHSLAMDTDNSNFKQIFDIKHLPKLILVNQNGNIIYTNEGTEESDLVKTMEEISK